MGLFVLSKEERRGGILGPSWGAALGPSWEASGGGSGEGSRNPRVGLGKVPGGLLGAIGNNYCLFSGTLGAKISDHFDAGGGGRATPFPDTPPKNLSPAPSPPKLVFW